MVGPEAEKRFRECPWKWAADSVPHNRFLSHPKRAYMRLEMLLACAFSSYDLILCLNFKHINSGSFPSPEKNKTKQQQRAEISRVIAIRDLNIITLHFHLLA